MKQQIKMEIDGSILDGQVTEKVRLMIRLARHFNIRYYKKERTLFPQLFRKDGKRRSDRRLLNRFGYSRDFNKELIELGDRSCRAYNLAHEYIGDKNACYVITEITSGYAG